MSDYTPSADEAREDTIDWLILLGVSPVGAERGVDSLIEAVRAEEREKAAQISEEFDPVEAALAGRYAGKDIAARIRNQEAGE